MPAQVQGVAIGLPFSSSSSSSSGSLERRAGAGERAVRSGALSSSAQRGEAQLSRGRVRGSVSPPPPPLWGLENPGFSSWFFCLYCKLSGFGDRCSQAPAPGSCRMGPAWGRDPVGAPWARAGGGGGTRSVWPCLSVRPRAPTALFVHSSFNLLGSCCAQDNPINPALVILFYFHPSPFLLTESRLCFAPFFVLVLCSPGPEPTLRCPSLPPSPPPPSSSASFWFLLQLLVPPLPLLPSHNWCSLDNLQSPNPPFQLPHILAGMGLGRWW